MFKLRRFYVDTIGVPDNRFVDLCVDATDLSDQPCDTIAWLRNGAGKTTMLSLLLALVLPDRRDFLAYRTKQRTLEDLVGGPDTAHVVAEWVDPRGERLLTGAVYQWEGRVRPRNYNKEGKDRMKRRWWCLRPETDVDGATFETIPTTSRTAGAFDLERFVAHIGDLATQGVNATATDKIGEWHEALRQRRFDPDLFRYFSEVNAAEGGMDGLFAQIDSARAFARYLLRFVADERRIVPVRGLLSETATEIAKRPTYMAERDFCTEAQPRVTALGEAHDKVSGAFTQRAQMQNEAAGFKAALIAAASDAEEEARSSEHRCADTESRRVDMRNRTDALRRQRDEYHRLAAAFRVAAARAELLKADATASAIRLDADAWTALPDLLALREASLILDAHRRLLRSSADEGAPALEAVELARADLAGSLEHHLGELTQQVNTLDRALSDMAAAKRAAEAERRNAVQERANLTAEREAHTQSLERADVRQRRLVDEGLLRLGERLSAAVDRLDADAADHESTITRLGHDLQAAARERKGVREALPAARTAAADSSSRHRQLKAEADRLQDASQKLAADIRLRELAQADDVDPIGEAHDLLAALAEAATSADAAVIDIRVEGADDDRAIAALETDGVLPPRQAVALVVRALADAEIAAYAGWHYIATHHATNATDIIARMPEVADGVIIYGDPEAAAAELDDLVVTDPVVIAPAVVFSQPGTNRVMVGPSLARHDRHAATTELEMRRTRTSTRSQRLAALVAGRRRDDALATELRHLCDQVPDDGVDALMSRVAEADTAAREAIKIVNAMTAREEELDNLAQELDRKLSGEHSGLARVDAAKAALFAAVDEERDVVLPARTRLEVIPMLIKVAHEAESKADIRISSIDAERDAHTKRHIELSSKRLEWETARAPLGPARPTIAPIESCRRALRIAERALKEQFPEDELRRRIDEVSDTVEQLTQHYNAHTAAVRERAEATLVVDAAAQDPELRASATTSARDRAERAQQHLGAARREADEAAAELQAHTPDDRPRHTPDLPTEPVDRAHALQLASVAAEQAAERQLEVGRLERERDGADEAAKSWRARRGLLHDQMDKLPSIEPAERAVGDVATNDDRLRQDVAALAKRLDRAVNDYANAVSGRSERAESLRLWAHDERFAQVADDEHGMAVRQLRELLRGDHLVDRVAPRARELTADLATRQRAIDQQIDQVDTHKRNVVVRLTDVVGEALTDLSRASSLSELPPDIGPWAGHPFLIVAPRTRPTSEQVQLRVGELIDRMVALGKVDLDATELLWQATDAAVTDGFRASILKPAPDQPSGRAPVEDMRKWSGGENLTASLMLFCVMAKLRAENRTGVKSGAVGGVVPLDNPLGKANYLPFIELQRKVAAANGVQLLFWTGIGDLGAVTAFPRIAAMRKKPAAGRPGVAYVVADSDASSTAGQATQIVEHLGAVRAEQ